MDELSQIENFAAEDTLQDHQRPLRRYSPRGSLSLTVIIAADMIIKAHQSDPLFVVLSAKTTESISEACFL